MAERFKNGEIVVKKNDESGKRFRFVRYDKLLAQIESVEPIMQDRYLYHDAEGNAFTNPVTGNSEPKIVKVEDKTITLINPDKLVRVSEPKPNTDTDLRAGAGSASVCHQISKKE